MIMCKVKLNQKRIRNRPHNGFVCFDSCLGSTLAIINWFVLTSLRFLYSFFFSHLFALFSHYFLPCLSHSIPPVLVKFILISFASIMGVAWILLRGAKGGRSAFLSLHHIYAWCVSIRVQPGIVANSSVWLSFKRQIVAIFQWIPQIWCNLNKFTALIINHYHYRIDQRID